MYRLRLSIALAAIALVSSAGAKPESYVTPSYTLAHATELDGREITVRRFVELGTNSRCLYDSMEAFRRRDGSGAQVITLSGGDNLLRRKAELNHRFVVVTGTFKKTFNGPDVLDLYQCNEAGIDQKTVRRSRK